MQRLFTPMAARCSGDRRDHEDPTDEGVAKADMVLAVAAMVLNPAGYVTSFAHLNTT
jgi:hypothetical protein